MDRRQFVSATAASLASQIAFTQDKPRRVGLIGCGWYGKADLFRLVQVAPVEIVSLCDVDKTMLSQAAEMAATRQKIGLVEICCYYHMRNTANPPDTPPPANLDYEMWTGPAPMRPYNALTHPGSWRLFMEYCNGIVGDMCIHMFDMVRWMLDLGWPRRISSSGGILVQKEAKANTTDTQTVTFDYDDLKVIWTHRMWGEAPDPKYPWSATIYG